MMTNLIFLLPALSLILLSCEKKTDSDTLISIKKANYSGCFNSRNKSLESVSEMSDSLYFVPDEDELNLFIDIVYSCCGELKDSVVIDSSVVSVYLKDKNPESYACNCICLYKINYSITNYRGRNIDFKVYMKNIAGNKFSLWKEIWYVGLFD
ncbi:MAG: hypothetical protein Q8905_13345 [Bacteroidota bacterium]|nr:hypothetical protein [Bacteroidota bacterium]